MFSKTIAFVFINFLLSCHASVENVAENSRNVLKSVIDELSVTAGVTPHSNKMATMNDISSLAQNLRRNFQLSAAPTSWVNILSYTSSTTCSGTSLQDSIGVGACYAGIISGTSVLVTVASNVATLTTYTASTTCTGANTVQSIPSTGACTASGTKSLAVTTSSSLPSRNGGVTFSYYGLSSDCVSMNANVQEVLYSSSNCFGTVSISCSGSNVLSTSYTGDGCTGTATANPTVPATTSCATLTTGAYTSGYMLPACPPSSSSSSSCFAGSETVEMESGEVRLISEVQIGDRILAADATGATSFSSLRDLLIFNCDRYH